MHRDHESRDVEGAAELARELDPPWDDRPTRDELRREESRDKDWTWSTNAKRDEP